LLAGSAAGFLTPFIGPIPLASAATSQDLHFRALWKGRSIGQHSVTFQIDGDRMIVNTHIDIVVKFLFFTAFRLKHDAREVWQSRRLVSVTSKTQRDRLHMQVSGHAVENDFLVESPNGPLLLPGNLMTTNSLWDSRIVERTGLIDVQYGGQVGLVTKPLGYAQVATPLGPVRAYRYQIITPYFAGSVFYDDDLRWIKAQIELKGETIEYVLTA